MRIAAFTESGRFAPGRIAEALRGLFYGAGFQGTALLPWLIRDAFGNNGFIDLRDGCELTPRKWQGKAARCGICPEHADRMLPAYFPDRAAHVWLDAIPPVAGPVPRQVRP